MKILDHLLGRHLASQEEHQHKIGPWAGLPMLGLDGLSSSAYGPEAAATVLIPLGALGATYVLPITLAIVVLLAVVYFSYRQTIAAYPNGGGSYTVAKENLGTLAGLVAGAALLLDYVLVVAVGISAGVGSLVSAIPALQPWTLSLCLVTLSLIALVNLRGVKESGMAFLVPTYLFVVCLFGIIAAGVFESVATQGHPHPSVPLPSPAGNGTSALAGATALWLIARAFAAGCTAMTGVEAVSNGTKAFREPMVKNARTTLTLITGILAILLVGIAYLARAYGIVATDPGVSGYESLISQLIAAVAGRGIVYDVSIGSVIAVLIFSANTGFADFPRTCQILARDNFLPHAFAERGRRLVFSYGILVLTALAGLLLVVFGGITDNLIPLFAIGAFLAFTLSQAGMVQHWRRQGGRPFAMLINGLGAAATAATLAVILVSKFTEGGWITVVLIPLMLVVFYKANRHYKHVGRQLMCREPLDFRDQNPPIVLVPVRGWSRLTRKAVHFATLLTPDVYGVHVQTEQTGAAAWAEEQWRQYVTAPALAGGRKPPVFVQLPNPYRRLFGSLVDYIETLKAAHPGRRVAIVIPDVIENRWYHSLLHNQRAVLLRTVLRIKADPRVVVITVPWYLDP